MSHGNATHQVAWGNVVAGEERPVLGKVRKLRNGTFVGSRKLSPGSPELGLSAMQSWWCSVRGSCRPRALRNAVLPTTELDSLTMWNLDDPQEYVLVHRFTVPWACTWADMRPGHTDKEKRERIRSIATQGLPPTVSQYSSWAFRARVGKSGKRPFDIENVPKLIIDAFCLCRIRADASAFPNAVLYPDDTVDYVQMLQVAGARAPEDATEVEIYALKRSEDCARTDAG